MRPPRDLRRAALLPVLVLFATVACAQPPTVQQTPEKIVVANAFYRATLVRARGGFLSEVALPDGMPILSNDLIYTDHGIYPEGSSVGTDREPNPEWQVRQEGERVTVESRGMFAGDGLAKAPDRRLAYTVSYTADASPAIQVRLAVTPSFALAQPSGFFSYLVSVPRFSEWFAKTADGVVYQPAGRSNGRCFESASQSLDPGDPWVGMLLPDGSIVALSGLRGAPEFGDVFIHENGQGAAGLFCAWLSGAATTDLVPGKPWTGEFQLHVWPKSRQTTVAMPPFLG